MWAPGLSNRMFTKIEVGFAVRSARVSAQRSAADLAKKCGMLPTTLSKVESGKRSLTFGEAAQICDALGIGVDDLARLAEVVRPKASKAASLREQLKQDLRALERNAIKQAIAINTSIAAGK